MHRTQLYLEEFHYQALRSQARQEGKSMAAVLREILDAYFGIGGGAPRDDPFDRVVGIGDGDGAAVAEAVDDHLYGNSG